MNEKLQQLVRHFLNEYASDLSDNSCNDLDESVFSGWSDEEKLCLLWEYNVWDKSQGGDGDYNSLSRILDFALVRFLANRPQSDSWIPVSERLPEEKDADLWGQVLAWNMRVNNSVKIDYRELHVTNGIYSHWQPLPSPPTNK